METARWERPGRRPLWLTVLIAPAAAAVALAAGFATGRPGADDDALLAAARERFRPLPKDAATPDAPVTRERVELGRMLFFEPRASADGTVSCSRCHLSALHATDGLPKSRGAHDKLLPRNAPTILNTALHFRQHWRGDFASVEEQATHALLGPGFANPDYATAERRIRTIPGYEGLFRTAFPGERDPVTAENWGKAIGAYERTLMAPSRFDDYLGGKADALTADERHGLRVFMGVGCAGCHGGVGLGGDRYRKFGVRADYWPETHSPAVDKGRFDLTGDPADTYVFKVPGLRGAAATPPYFHDGSVGTLPEAVRVMARVQLGKTLADADTAAVVTFLGSLTGKAPAAFTTAPTLPSAGYDAAPAAGQK